MTKTRLFACLASTFALVLASGCCHHHHDEEAARPTRFTPEVVAVLKKHLPPDAKGSAARTTLRRADFTADELTVLDGFKRKYSAEPFRAVTFGECGGCSTDHGKGYPTDYDGFNLCFPCPP